MLRQKSSKDLERSVGNRSTTAQSMSRLLEEFPAIFLLDDLRSQSGGLHVGFRGRLVAVV